MNGAKEARRAKEWGKGLYHRLSGNYEVVNNLAQYYSTGNFRIGDKPGGKSARKHFIRPNGGKLAVSLSVL
jgi:hypothetical protein